MKISIRADALASLLLTVGMLLLAGVSEVLLTGWEFTPSDLILFSVLAIAGLAGVLFAESTPRIRGSSAGMLYFFGVQIVWYLLSVVGIVTLTKPSTADLLFGVLFGVAFVLFAKQIDDWGEAARRVEKYQMN